MFEPEAELVSTHRVSLSTGEAIVFDQSLWGKVIEVRELHVGGGRFELDDYAATVRLRQLLEAATVQGEWAYEPEHEICGSIRTELHSLIELLFGNLDEF